MAQAERWRSRIVKTAEEDPEQLLANPLNWRIHPKHQQDALEGVLDDVGWVQNVIVNERTGHVIDGHLRITLAIREGQPKVPVVYVDLSEDEEQLVLAALDPIADLAVADADKLEELLHTITTDNPAVQEMLRELAKNAGIEATDIFEDLVGGGDDFAGTEVTWEVVVPAPSPGDRDAVVDLLKDNGWEATVRTVRP